MSSALAASAQIKGFFVMTGSIFMDDVIRVLSDTSVPGNTWKELLRCAAKVRLGSVTEIPRESSPSGYIGRYLVPRLLVEGRSLRAVARRRATLETRGWHGVEIVEADALKPATLSKALAGVSVAYYLVHSMASGRHFGQLDIEAVSNFAAAAAAAGVRRIAYLGGIIPEGARSEHLLSRRDTGERLRAGPVPVIEIRAAVIVGVGSAPYEVIRDLVYHLPVMVTPQWVQSRSAPIALDNLLTYLVRVAELPEAEGQMLDAGGPGLLSYEAMMRQFADCVGRRPFIIRVPVLTPNLSSRWPGLVTGVPTNIAQADPGPRIRYSCQGRRPGPAGTAAPVRFS
jgi:uncharacterized protein YbjT (DUF2867 family)